MWERTQIQLKQITSRVHFWSHYSESQVSPAHTASQTCQRNQLNNTELTFFWLETNRLIERQQSSVLSPSQLLSHCAGLSPRESIVFHLPAFYLNTLPHKYFPSRTKLCLRCMRLGQKEEKRKRQQLSAAIVQKPWFSDLRFSSPIRQWMGTWQIIPICSAFFPPKESRFLARFLTRNQKHDP